MDQFRESLDRIGELSDDELKTLKDSVKSEFDTVATQDPTHDVVDTMTQLADAAEAIKAETDHRVAEAAQLAQAASDAQSRMSGLSEDGSEDGSGDEPTDAEESAPDVTDDSAPADAPVDAEAPAADPTADPAEGSPEEEAKETPEDEAKEDAPDGDEAPKDDSKDNNPSDDELTDEEKKKLNTFSDTSVETTIDAPAESEAAVVEQEEAPATVEAVAELSNETVETVEENAPEAEAPAEAPAEAELSTEETAPSTTEAEVASEETESSEEPVTASNTPLDFQAPADNAPAIAAVEHAPVTITAGADIPGVPMGSELPDLRSVAQALLDRKKAMGRTSGGDGEQHTVAQFTTVFPADRTLSSSDFDGNSAKIEAVVSAEAIVAAGGFMAPVPVRYELFGLGDTNRPVKDSLAVFGADRGGIRYITPPVLTDLDGSVSLWTLQDDLDALTDTSKVKPCIRVAAGAEVTVYVDAIPLCLTFGNLGARAYPELVERHTQLGMIWHARYAETRLLTRIGSLSTPVTADKQLGAVRDILGQVDKAAAGYRNRHRIAADSPLRVIFPEWFKDALRSDIAKQLPGDGLDDTLALAEAKINSWFSARHINVTWSLDGESGQIMGAQASGALNDYPANVIWYLFAEGTFLFLDQGTLDLGLVRDSTLNSTNDYKIFLETFEGVAKVGVEALRVTTTLAIRGSSSATTVI